jgi:hypothetical protein
VAKVTATSETRPVYLRGVISRRKHKGNTHAVMMEIHNTLSLSRFFHSIAATKSL